MESTDKLKRILEVLLADAPDLDGLTICQRAGLGAGTITPDLVRLEGLGWAESDWEATEPLGRPRRRFYHLTQFGRTRALNILGHYERGEGTPQ